MKISLFRFVTLLFIVICIPFHAFADDSPVLSESSADPELPVIKPAKKPVYIEADRIQGYYEQEIEAVGDVKLSCGDVAISAGRMKYFQKTNDVEAADAVHIERPKDELEGTNLKLNLETEVGHLDQPTFRMKDGEGRGTGTVLLFEGEDNYRLKKGQYTTCPAGNDDWFVRADDLQIDNEKQIGTARNVSVLFKDVPILYLPWMDFSFSGERKTGMLSPILGNTARSGAEVSLPFYWNIAPNFDATFTPRIMSKRGLMLRNEVRYMSSRAVGQLQADVLPDDWIDDRTRYGVAYTHTHFLTNSWRANLDYNKVSDDQFVRDLANNLALTSRINLLQRAATSYTTGLGAGGVLDFTAEVQRFQTLQDPRLTSSTSFLVSPFKRLPQFTLNAIKRNIAGLDLNFSSSWANFTHQTFQGGKRLTLFPSVSMPLHNAYGFITPKVGLHYTRYNMESRADGRADADRLLPIVSLDSGVVFDRNMTLRGERFIQTLEPRAFYVYIPFKDQNLLPIFDSAENDFGFAQMLTENRFSGNDRINDANQVTLALASRLIEPGTGIERLRIAVGQQFLFRDRRVTLNSPQGTNQNTNFVAAISGRITSTISTDTDVQYDINQFRNEKIRTGISYRPEPGKVINLGYRFSRDVFEQVDTSIQWPFALNWNGVARVSYSLRDDKLLAGLAGFEYRSCCWAFSLVAQRFTTATQKTSTALFVQLELNSLMNIGVNPLRVLQDSIPGYSRAY
jgi:LPS-assembly protein